MNSLGIARPSFIDGEVKFDDGTPPNSNIAIQRVCSSSVRLQGYTDAKGHFYFQLGDTSGMDMDAATSSADLSSPGVPEHSMMVPITGMKPSQMGCEVRASYPGYTSDRFPLTFGRDEVHVGTLLLHRIGGVNGTTLSVTTAQAPKRAQKDYEKGMHLVAKNKLEEAEHDMQDAVKEYPQYALAWFALGQLQQKRGELAGARAAYQAAIKSDAHYVSPYIELAELAAREKNWQDVLTYTKQTLSLNSVEFPSAYWYNAVANLQLSNWSDAEQSLTKLTKMDTLRRYPQAEGVLGRMLFQKGDLAGAAEHLRAYLIEYPKAPDAASVRTMLDNMAANAAPPQH